MEASLTLDESFSEFLYGYPSYKSTTVIDAWRHEEYPHLDKEGQVRLDYTGIGLFSSSQRNLDLYGGFGIGLSPTSANLATHAMYMEGGSTESFFRKRVLRYLNLDEEKYYIVFTANALSAFKLLGYSYPFHEASNFLSAYDHDCENVEAITECTDMKRAHVHSVDLMNPQLKINVEDLRKKLQGKRKPSTRKICSKGLFVYPHTSRVTGSKNPTEWVLEAQENGWHVLLDVTSTDAKCLGPMELAQFSPDFLICSFYYVFGEDPAGFGCLVIRQPVLRTLGDSSRARAVGMMKIVTKQSFSTIPNGSFELHSGTSDLHLQRPRNNEGHRHIPFMGASPFGEELTDSSECLTRSQNAAITGATEHVSDDIMEGKGIAVSCMSALISSSLEATGREPWESAKDMAVRKPTEKDTAVRKPTEKVTASTKMNTTLAFGLRDLSSRPAQITNRKHTSGASMDIHFTCGGLDHADALGYEGVSIRLRTLSSWLISSLLRLRHLKPDSTALVKIYSPRSPAERGSIVAFTLLDSTGKVFDPKRVQMLADRNNILLRTGIIAGSTSSDSREAIEDPLDVEFVEVSNHKWRFKGERVQIVHLPVLYASLGFLNNFSDVYRVLLFVSKFLDPDFVSRELWHYRALNQETIKI